MMKVDTDGTNTMVMAVMMPGMLKGSSTLVKTRKPLAPKSWAASMTDLSIFTMMECRGVMAKGR